MDESWEDDAMKGFEEYPSTQTNAPSSPAAVVTEL